MAPAKLQLLTYANNPRTSKILIAAKYAGVEIEVPKFNFGEDGDNKSPDYIRNVHPLGKVPALQTPDGYIFESYAIARHIARLGDARCAGLYGRTAFEAAQVDMWCDYANAELDPAVTVWVGPVLGYLAANAAQIDQAKKKVAAAMQGLDQWLQTRTFLVGERLTLADICCVCAILPLYQVVMGPEERRPYTDLNRWFDTCINQPHFQQALEPGELFGSASAAKKGDQKKEDKQKGKDEKKGGGEKKGKEEKKGGGEKQPKEDKKKGDQQKGSPKGKDKGGKKAGSPKAAAAPAAGADEKKLKAVKKEGGKKAQDLAGMADMGSLFQQAMLNEPEGRMDLLEMALEAMNKEVDPESEERKGGAGGVAKILISAGDSCMSIIVHVPEMFTKADAEGNVRGYEISAADWLEAALANLPGDGKGAEITQKTPTLAKCTYQNDPEKGRFVLKAKDAVSGASFSFLRSKSLVVDDDDSDEMVFGDDDMPGF